MSSQKESNDSYVKRNAMLSVSADGKKFFRTTLFGYNKVAVNDYIDRLYSEYSEGEKALTQEISKLRQINSALKEKNDEYDSQFEAVKAKVSSELAFVSEYHQLAGQYNSKIDDLRKETESLEEKVKAGDELNTSLLERLESSINRADDLQKSLDSQKETLTRVMRERDNAVKNLEAASQGMVVKPDPEMEKQIAELTYTIDQIQQASADRESELGRQIETLKENASVSSLKLAEAEQERDNAVAVADAASNQLKQIRVEFHKRVAQLISQRDTAIAANNDKMQAHYDAMLKVYEKKASDLQQDNIRLTAEKESALEQQRSDSASTYELQSRMEEMQKEFESRTAEFELNYAALEEEKNQLAEEKSQLAEEKSQLAEEKSRLAIDSEAEKNALTEKIGVLTGERDRAVSSYNMLARNGQEQVQGLQKEFQVRMQRVQNIVTSMQNQNSKLQQSVNERSGQLKQVIGRYNSAVEELNKRQRVISELRTKLTDENQKQMEKDFKINSLNSEMVRRDISLSQRDNEIIALRNYISDLENRLGYAVGYQNGHKSSFEVAYRNSSQQERQQDKVQQG